MQTSLPPLRVLRLTGFFLALALAGRDVAAASIELSIPTIGTGLPALSVSFGIANYVNSPTSATVTFGHFTREIDAHSPAVQAAVLLGTVFPTATISLCKTVCSSATTYLTLTLQDVFLTSYAIGTGFSTSTPYESIGYTARSMTAAYVPLPNDQILQGKTAWGWMLPADLPAGGAEPYAFAFDIDAAAAEALFNRPLSSLGDGLPATLYNAAVAPVPPAAWLLGSALGLLGWARRRR